MLTWPKNHQYNRKKHEQDQSKIHTITSALRRLMILRIQSLISLHCALFERNAPSEDSDQPGHPPSLITLRCRHEETLGRQLTIERSAKTLIRLSGWPG